MDPISAISKILELISQLITLKGKRRRAVFSEILEPIFQRIEEVNVFYRELFLNSIAAIPVQRDGKWEVYENSRRVIVPKATVLDRIEQIKRELIEKREKGSEIRDQLRIHAAEMLKSVEGNLEKRFLITVIFYFLEEAQELDTDSMLDWLIEQIEQVGGISALSTPARYIADYIERKTDAVQVRSAFEGILKGLERKFQDVNRAFINLKLDVLTKT